MTIPLFKPTITLNASNLTSSDAAGWVARVAACPIDTSWFDVYGTPPTILDSTVSVATTSGVQAARTITLNYRQAQLVHTIGTNCTDLLNAFGDFMRQALTQCLCTPVAITNYVIVATVTPCT